MPKVPPARKTTRGPKLTHKPSKRRKIPRAAAVSAQVAERKVIYPEYESRLCSITNGSPITEELARELLMWEEETDKVKFGDSYLLKDFNNHKVRCYNNSRNRPFEMGLAKKWASEILKGHWRINGVPLIIGKTGETISAQHRLIGLILAVQEWRAHPERWPYWKTEPVLETFAVFGIDESDETVNTIDTGKPRDLADVLFRSQLLESYREKDRKTVARYLKYAVAMLWSRTGAGADAWIPQRSHTDSIEFIERHPRILPAVKHIWEENGKSNRIGGPIIPVGYAAGLLYLMGSANSDLSVYRAAKPRTEEPLDWSNWERACDFWVLLAGESPDLAAVHEAIKSLLASQEEGGEGSTVAERTAIVAKAWLLYAAGQPVTTEALALKYSEDEDGVRHLDECPTVGGIDCGDDPDPEPPTEEEIEERAAEVREEHAKTKLTKKEKEYGQQLARDMGLDDTLVDEAPEVASLAPKPKRAKAKPAPRPKAGAWATGQTVWVKAPDPYQGRILRVQGKRARVRVETGHQGAGTLREVPVAKLSRTQPTA